jgi:hypothetical protein
MLISLPEELRLLTSPIGPIMIAYFLSRASTLAFVLSCVIVKAYPESHCQAQELGVAICWMISTASSSFLFLRRTHAIFNARRYWQHFYSCLYIVNVGISFVVPIGNHAGPFGQTGWCINTNVQYYVVAAVFSRLIFDSCVFIGISYELATSHSLPGEVVTWRTFITGKASSRLMRALLRGGQQYYLISVCSNLLIVLLIVVPVPPLFQSMFNVPDLALSSSMACRVLRNLKVSALKDISLGLPSSSAGTFPRPLMGIGAKSENFDLQDIESR